MPLEALCFLLGPDGTQLISSVWWLREMSAALSPHPEHFNFLRINFC